MMSGNRWRLFCLQFSFIGWDILSAVTLGAGSLWVRPYRQAAYAAFYREVSETEQSDYRVICIGKGCSIPGYRADTALPV